MDWMLKEIKWKLILKMNHFLHFTWLLITTQMSETVQHSKGGVYLGAGYGILASIFRFFVQMTWKINIVEGLDAS